MIYYPHPSQSPSHLFLVHFPILALTRTHAHAQSSESSRVIADLRQSTDDLTFALDARKAENEALRCGGGQR